jgi:hypothetical protein
MLKIPEECVTEKELPHLLTERVIISYTSLTDFLTLDYEFC